MASESTLSSKDRDILDCIFSPNQTYGMEHVVTDDSASSNADTAHSGQTEGEKKGRELEVLGVQKAEQAELDIALSLLNQAVENDPQSASIYNNRAQIYLLKGNKEAAHSDLMKSLELCQCCGKVAGQAYTQLGLIHRLNGNNEQALNDFKKAAALGNLFAKSQVASMNPYAALCNQMLSQAIGQLRNCGAG